MTSLFLYHVVGDLTVGKPELSEFVETETLEAAIKAIEESSGGEILVWKKRSLKSVVDNAEIRQQRFVGTLNALDVVAFLAREDALSDQDKAVKTPVSEVVAPNNSALKVVDPGTRLIDVLEMMKQGVKHVLVPKSLVWRGMSKRFSILYNGKWLKNVDASGGSSLNIVANSNRGLSSSTSSIQDKFCCLSREDVLRFLIGCLGALAPLPLSSISSLGVVNSCYCCIEASCQAIDSIKKIPNDPCAVAVVESTQDDQPKIIGEISSKLWKCDYSSAAWALANLSAGQFVMGVEDSMNSKPICNSTPNEALGRTNVGNDGRSTKTPKFSSRGMPFFNNSSNPYSGMSRNMYRGRSAPLTCKVTSSLAAVMAQMLSHRVTHVWVTEADMDDNLVGIVGYADILAAVMKHPAAIVSDTHST